jgi:hypothetical protein
MSITYYIGPKPPEEHIQLAFTTEVLSFLSRQGWKKQHWHDKLMIQYIVAKQSFRHDKLMITTAKQSFMGTDACSRKAVWFSTSSQAGSLSVYISHNTDQMLCNHHMHISVKMEEENIASSLTPSNRMFCCRKPWSAVPPIHASLPRCRRDRSPPLCISITLTLYRIGR